jgi:dipeptidyl-peptidase-4
VFLDNSLAAVSAMQKAGTRFEMMFYPGYTHRVGGPVSVHLWRTIEDFLDRNVKNAK